MVKFDLLDYGVYCECKHIADFDDLYEAKGYAKQLATRKETNVIIVNNLTGEICGEFVVKSRMEIVEVEP